MPHVVSEVDAKDRVEKDHRSYDYCRGPRLLVGQGMPQPRLRQSLLNDVDHWRGELVSLHLPHKDLLIRLLTVEACVKHSL